MTSIPIKAKNPLLTSDSDEWYTPQDIIQRVNDCIGPIDIDPCSEPWSAEHPFRVPAQHHFTKAMDGLSRPWFGHVFVNPPYGRALPHWVLKTYLAHNRGETGETILLVPARTDTKWFQYLWEASRVCFVRGRISFESPAGAKWCAPFPSAIAYWGPSPTRFEYFFTPLGHIVTP